MKIEQSKNPKLLTNGFVKTSGSDGTLSVDTNTYATGSGTASGTNTGDQDLSGLVPYTGATGDVTLGVHGLTLHDIKGDASDGLLIEANNGTDIAILGAGNTASGTWYGSHNIEGTQVAIGKNATTIGKLKLYGNTSGDVTIQPNAVAGTGVVLTAPATTGTLALTSDITGTNSGTNTGDQTITNSSDATSHTVTLSATGGSVQLIEGSGITLTTGGTASAGTVTVAASGGSGATTALDNLASVAINTSLVSDTDNTDDLGTTLKKWANLFVTTIGATATRITKGWFTDLEVTNLPTVNGGTLASALNLSGTNTGDQTSVSGNAGTATALATPRTIGTATGDVTSAGSSFDGSANNTNALTIANSAVTLAKMADLAQDQFIGRTTASTGVPQTATITAAARTVLDDTTVGAMVDTLGGASSTGTGGIARATSPTFVTPALGTPSSGDLSNCTGIPASMFKSLLSTCFEDTGRFIQNATSGTGTFGVEGCLLDTTSTTTRSYRLRARNYSTSRFLTFAGSPQWTASINVPAFAGTGSFYIGMGAVSCDGTGHTFTDSHIGFKILVAAGVASLYATQADGTETASSALTTLATSDNLELYILVTGTTTVSYYWRKNGGALSSATALTTNIPTGSDNTWFQGSCSNNSTANQQQLQLQGASYSR